MLDQARHSAERFSQRKQLAALEEAARVLDAARKLDRYHAAVGAVAPWVSHLRARERVLRMRAQPRIVHARDLRMALEKTRQLQCILAVPLHAQRERLPNPSRQK